MTAEFNHYHQWLGIPPAEQPPHHYRLLSVTLFETNDDVIAEAADRQMAHVQTHKNGRYSALSQSLLNELASAKLCLLNPQRKAAYDKALREKRAASSAPAAKPKAVEPRMVKTAQPLPVAAALPVETSGAPGAASPAQDPAAANSGNGTDRKRSKTKKAHPAVLVAEIIAGAAILGLVYWAVSAWQGSQQIAEKDKPAPRSETKDKKASPEKRDETPKKQPETSPEQTAPPEKKPEVAVKPRPAEQSPKPPEGPPLREYARVVPNGRFAGIATRLHIVGDEWRQDLAALPALVYRHAPGRGKNRLILEFSGLNPNSSYAVLVPWHAGPDLASNARYVLRDSQRTLQTFEVDQRVEPHDEMAESRWHKSLGNIQAFDGKMSVEFSDDADGVVSWGAVTLRARDAGNLAASGQPARESGNGIDTPKSDDGPKVVRADTAIHCLAADPESMKVVYSGDGATIYIWRPSGSGDSATMSVERTRFTGLAYAGDGHCWASALQDRQVDILDNTTNQRSRMYVTQDSPTCVALDATGTHVAAGTSGATMGATVQIWDVGAGTSTTWKGLPSAVSSVALSPNGAQVLASCGGAPSNGFARAEPDPIVHWFDVKSQREIPLKGHSGGVLCVAFSRDGRQAASGSEDRTIRLWDLKQRKVLQKLEGHTDAVRALAFSKDGTQLLSAGNDRTVRLWDLNSGKELKSFEGHTQTVRGVAFLSDGQHFVSGGEDSTLRIWTIPEIQPASVPPEELFAESKSGLAPAPSEAEQQKGLKLIKDVYQDEFKAAKKPADKLALAKKLLGQSAESTDSTEQFVLLAQARDLARDAGAADLVLQAIGKLAERFDVDLAAMTADTLEAMSGGTSKIAPAARKEIAENVLRLVDRAAAQNRYAGIDRLLELARISASKASAPDLTKQIVARRAEIAAAKKLFDAAKEAADTLADSPDNDDANLTLGRYLCFIRNDWKQGLPLLAKGSDAKLKSIAQEETAPPTTPEDQAKLGGDWLEFLESASGQDKAAAQSRVEHWYSKALPDLKGLTQVKVSKWLEANAAGHTVAGHTTGGKAEPATAAENAPGPSPAVAALVPRIRQAVRKNLLSRTAPEGRNNGTPFSEVPPAGGLLGGFNITFDNSYQALSSIQPIYLTQKGTAQGGIWGTINGDVTTVLAKKGYAVSGLKVIGDYRFQAIQVVFAKVDQATLDTNDSYTSEWIGSQNAGRFGITTKTIGDNGQPNVGLFGVVNQQVFALGLVQLAPPPK